MYREFRNTFLFGLPGTGKSKFTRSYIEEVIYDKTDASEIVLVCHKDLGYRSGKIVEEIMGDYENRIKDLYAKYQERLANPEARYLPKLYVFVDGLTKTLAKCTPEVETLLGEMMENGPRANVWCVYTSSSKDFAPALMNGSTVIELK
jgi:hypothetical protein